MFNNFKENNATGTNGGGGYQQQQQQHQLLPHGLPQSDSMNQNIGLIHNSLRNLTSYTQYTAQQLGTSQELVAGALKEGFKSVCDSLNNLSRQMEINNKITLFTLNNICNSSNNGENTVQEHASDKRRGEEFRKLVNYVGNVDNSLLKDNQQASLGSNLIQGGLNRTSSGSRAYSSLSNLVHQAAPQLQQQQQQNPQLQLQQQQLQQQQQQQLQLHVNSGRRDLSHHGSSTSLSASLKSNITPPGGSLRLLSDKRQYQTHMAAQQNHTISAPVPQAKSVSQQQQQQHQRARTSSQLASLDSASPDSLAKKQKKSYKDHEPIYVLTQPSKVTIREAWLEYTVGLNGSPAVRDLENQYKTRWRGGSNHTISKQYTNRIAFYKFLEDLEAQNSVEFGIKFLEDYCSKNGNKNLRWLQFNMPTELDFRRFSFENRGPSL